MFGGGGGGQHLDFPDELDHVEASVVWKEGFLRVLSSTDVYTLRYFKVRSPQELVYYRDYVAGQANDQFASCIDLRQVDRVELYTKLDSSEHGFKLESCNGTTLIKCLLPEVVQLQLACAQ